MSILVAAAAILGQITAQGQYQMTESEVQACGALAVQRNQHRAELTRRNADLDARTADLRAKQTETESLRATVNAKDKKAVERFNQQIASVNALRETLQPEIEARNRYTEETNQLVAAFNSRCANRTFNPTYTALLPPDQQAALRERATTRTITVPAEPPKRRR
jgi:hypothetical protein